MKKIDNQIVVSVIIPMYNAEETILDALESVGNQRGEFSFEIIIIDDASTDFSKNKVKDYQLRHPEMEITLLVQEKNSGVSMARNRGLEIAKGTYIAFLDADDEWLPQKTERQIAVLETHRNINFLASKRTGHSILFPYKINSDGLAEITFRKLLIRNETQPSTVIFRKEILRNTGFFNETQRYAEDVNYWLKISAKNQMYILNESLVIAGKGKRTFGISGLSSNLKAMENGFQNNILEMHQQKRINFIELIFYRCFQKLKYAILLFRNALQK